MLFKSAFAGYSIRFSPFVQGRVALSTSQNFGIVGNGKQQVLDVTPHGITEVASFDTLDGVYDCCWSEENENILLAASGDGSIRVYDLAAPPQANPLRSLNEHKHECCSLSWNLVQRDAFLSSSWDDTIKLWALGSNVSSRTFLGHTYCVYHVGWSPTHADVFLSASGDTTCKIWDCRQQLPTLALQAHAMEVLSADWCKYNDCIIATGSIDKTIKIWDVRNPLREMTTLMGHGYAVRRVVFSPHSETRLLSCSYDMTVKLWDYAMPEDSLLRSWDHHTEFAVGCDMSLLEEGMVASCGWDDMAAVWHMDQMP